MSACELAALPEVTLASLLERVDEIGDCLTWRGYALDGQHPQWRLGGRGGRLWNVRRLLWLLVHGRLDAGLQVGVSCTTALCVHPDHLAARTRSQACSGKPKAVDHRLRIALAKRASSVLSSEAVRAVCASAEPSVAIDAQLGLSRGYASKLRTGVRWAQHGGLFAGLGERGPQ